jgi:hypothetical protein
MQLRRSVLFLPLVAGALLCALAAAESARAVPMRPPPGQAGRDPLRPRGPRRPPLPTITPRTGIPPSCTAQTLDDETLTLVLNAPLPATVLASYEPCPQSVEVTGTATIGLPFFDIYFVIDSSGSTGACSGADIDQDGIVGVPGGFPTCSDPGDTVLAAEVRAVRDFAATLSPAVTRIAIIQFSMPEELLFGSRQRIVQSLTADFALVNLALDDILGAGSAGATDYAGGLHLLRDERLANGDPVGRRQLAYFLSDGVPTFPFGNFGVEEPPDSQASIDAADEVALLGLIVDTFGVGFIPSVTQDPVFPRRCLRPDGTESSTLECVALRTGGVFFESSDPAAIVDELRLRQPGGIAEVLVANETTGEQVVAVRAPDGTFVASVALEIGRVNHLRVTVTAEDGTSCEVTTEVLSLCYAAGSGCSPLTQGYWHRQCRGLGLIENGGVGPPPHPDWDPEALLLLMQAIVDPLVRALDSPENSTTCEGLDANPPDDKCEKAIKQYTAVLMNIHGGYLSPTCLLELPGYGILTPEEAAVIIADLIRAGLAGDPRACFTANDLADLINTGAAVQ